MFTHTGLLFFPFERHFRFTLFFQSMNSLTTFGNTSGGVGFRLGCFSFGRFALGALNRRRFEYLRKTNLGFQRGFEYLLLEKNFRDVADIVNIMLLDQVPDIGMASVFLD